MREVDKCQTQAKHSVNWFHFAERGSYSYVFILFTPSTSTPHHDTLSHFALDKEKVGGGELLLLVRRAHFGMGERTKLTLQTNLACFLVFVLLTQQRIMLVTVTFSFTYTLSCFKCLVDGFYFIFQDKKMAAKILFL